MEYPLKQIGCDDCGELTPVLDIDEQLPKGWVMISRFTHYCPRCKNKHKKIIEL